MNIARCGLLAGLLDGLFPWGDSSADQGCQSTLDWSVPWAEWITLLVLILATLLVIVIYVRERSGRGAFLKVLLAMIRISLIGLTVFMLYRAVLRPYRTDLPDLAILADVSQSMLVVDHYDGKNLSSKLRQRVRAAGLEQASRLNLAKTLLLEKDAALLRSLASRYNVRLYSVGDSARSLDADHEELVQQIRLLQASQQASRLGQCLQQVLQAQRGRPTAAVVLLTDGITTEGKTIGDVAQQAQRKGVPLFPIGLGSNKPLRDLRLTDLLVDEVVFVDEVVHFEFKITGEGYPGREVEVTLKKAEDPSVLARTTITLNDDGRSRQGRLTYRPTENGDFEYVVQVSPQQGESTTRNNQQRQMVSVRDDSIRVLLVQAYPNYEFRYLKNVLSRQLKSDGRDKVFDLTTVLQYADPEYAELDETAQRVFPVARDELFRYDVIVFGDVDPSFSLLSRSVMNNIADFVKQRGGGIVFIAGPRFTPMAYRDSPLADLFPVKFNAVGMADPEEVISEEFVVRPTALGLASPPMQLADTPAETIQLWQNLPGLYWLLEAPELKPAARILAEHPSRTDINGRNLPVIVMQYVGAGKVLFHATDETWRWRYRRGDELFGRYWMQTIRYLSRSKLLGKDRLAELTSDRRQYRRGDPVQLRVRFLDDRTAPVQDDGAAAIVEHKGGKSRRVPLHRSGGRGTFQALVTNLATGQYHAWLASPTLEGEAPVCDFTVHAPPGEQARLEMDEKDLRRAARQSEGRYYTFQTAKKLLRNLPAGHQVPIEALDPIPLWNSHLIAALFLALIVTEWLLRKWAGML